MAKVKVYYDFQDDRIKPFTMVISFRIHEVKWDKQSFYIPINAPFQRHMSEEYHDTFGYTVLLEDLTVNFDKPNTFGVHLTRLKDRNNIWDATNEMPVNFMIRMCDIEEVLQMNLAPYYEWSELS
ncbi:hypothetical protein [Paenibacillus koleovorans]|uniref:hypothetical protein n=1 Tax=Paenibacillus koleovorans TaxID=121608 RepID=UPI000FDB8633|nr:hypothetical protein [Paenibacillus koleovorans]